MVAISTGPRAAGKVSYGAIDCHSYCMTTSCSPCRLLPTFRLSVCFCLLGYCGNNSNNTSVLQCPKPEAPRSWAVSGPQGSQTQGPQLPRSLGPPGGGCGSGMVPELSRKVFCKPSSETIFGSSKRLRGGAAVRISFDKRWHILSTLSAKPFHHLLRTCRPRMPRITPDKRWGRSSGTVDPPPLILFDRRSSETPWHRGSKASDSIRPSVERRALAPWTPLPRFYSTVGRMREKERGREEGRTEGRRGTEGERERDRGREGERDGGMERGRETARQVQH